ncbi:MAG: hypothetical protein M1814_006062 [Vezdaea aestivalis]|nr:MAG: hypothetical protein M1814_006062 [Vezdaea aestivalis]
MLVAVYLLPYYKNRDLRRVRAPFPASLSNLWLMLQCRRGKRYAAVHEIHKRLGPVVRLQPNHVSIADVSAINIVYGHGTGFLKSEFYDAFVSIKRGLFNTRDRAEHTRKRKTISSIFSQKHVSEFEPYIQANLELLVRQWSNLCQSSPDDKYAPIDALHWMNYLAFDIIGDLAFGAPFGMLKEGKDIASVRLTPVSPVTYAPAIQVLNRRGEVSATLGCYPSLKSYAGWLPDPFFRNGLAAVQSLAGIAVSQVHERLESGKSDRRDLLARLMEARDEQGNRLGRDELTAEALTQLIAGSDTTSNTSCAILFWTLKTPGVMKKLQEELDLALPDGKIPSFSEIRHLK